MHTSGSNKRTSCANDCWRRVKKIPLLLRFKSWDCFSYLCVMRVLPNPAIGVVKLASKFSYFNTDDCFSL